MAGKASTGSKGLWWAGVAVLCVVVIAIAYFGTRMSQSQDARQPVAGAGTAYSTTTGQTTPAAATPGGMNTGKTATGSVQKP